MRLYPHPLPTLRAEHCCPAAAVRQPGYLLTRRPLGFAPPPHDGFALLASAHGCAYLATNILYIGSQPHAILLGGCIPRVEDALPCCFAPSSVSVMLALLPRGDEFRMNLSSCGRPLLCVSVAIPFLLRRGGHRYAPQQDAYKCEVMEKTRTYAKWPFLMALLVHSLGIRVLSETRRGSPTQRR